jgi:hypothetical protein
MIVTWVEDRRLRAQTFDAAGVPRASIEIGTPTRARAIAVAPLGARFAIVWSADAPRGPAILRAFATTAGLDGPPAVVVQTRIPRDVLGAVPTPSGLAVLLAGAYQAEVLSLDAAGAFRGLVQFAGLRAGWGLEARGDRLLLAATRSDRSQAVRLIDELGAPAAPWLCLTPPNAVTSPIAASATASGWAVAFRDEKDAERLVHLDTNAR